MPVADVVAIPVMSCDGVRLAINMLKRHSGPERVSTSAKCPPICLPLFWPVPMIEYSPDSPNRIPCGVCCRDLDSFFRPACL